ncbi:MAG: FAD-dependent oxidoreductase [Spirochaetaceae bacterium]|nr:MAG: FAD-dependent oxidoreductase [Spirochaetaceae bacterium]
MSAIEEYTTQVLIVGGGLGAVAAALSSCRLGCRTMLVAPDSWLGGQATSQGVPPDEHPWIESTGATASYREFRSRIRAMYREHLPLDSRWKLDPRLNPGGGHVSPITHDPRVSVQVIESMLLPFRVGGLLTILRGYRPVAADADGDRVRSVDFGAFSVEADYVLDATETGDLLPLAGVEYRTGAEAQSDFGEPHAPEVADEANMQAVSWCAVLGWDPGNRLPPVERPGSYTYWKETVAPFWPGAQLSFEKIDPITRAPQTSTLFGTGLKGADPEPGTMNIGGLWAYRRIHRPDLFSPGLPFLDATVLNWPQIDYWEGPVFDVPDAEQHLTRSRELTLSFIHWLQTEAPRHDGGEGYLEVILRRDMFETPHGLAREVYIRESRRIRARTMVTECDVASEIRPKGAGATVYADTVGLASYRIDLHPTTSGDSYIDIESYPAQIPLGALIPERVRNLIPACKNIGTTHLSSGMYRVHPAEWNIGEAAGALAAYSVQHGTEPHAVHERADLTADLQSILHDRLGFELEWPRHVAEVPRWAPQLQWIIREKRDGWRVDKS